MVEGRRFRSTEAKQKGKVQTVVNILFVFVMFLPRASEAALDTSMWYLGSTSQSCDSKCSSLGLTCAPAQIMEMNTESEVDEVATYVGLYCAKYSGHYSPLIEYYGGRGCWYFDDSTYNLTDAKAGCYIAADAWNKKLCACSDASPTQLPTPVPQPAPTALPTSLPTAVPTAVPTNTPQPSVAPSFYPSKAPTVLPTVSDVPSPLPTVSTLPSKAPSDQPSAGPSALPTSSPTPVPSALPTPVPSVVMNYKLPKAGEQATQRDFDTGKVVPHRIPNQMKASAFAMIKKAAQKEEL